MKNQRWFFLILFGLTISVFAFVVHAKETSLEPTPLPQATPSGLIATNAELVIAQLEWAQSAHADTYDNGMGANTTCARCKSPLNWDPTQDRAQQEALNCSSCKRIPGAPRPELPSGVRVDENNWQDIRCEVCHIPANDSYYTEVSFWDQAQGQYVSVESVDELCARCHEGQHGFEVVEEQEATLVHSSMGCTECHGAHGSRSSCLDCHNPALGAGAPEHVRHLSVNCSACHDAGGLSVWYETDPASPHYGEYITRRFAHNLTSWPSHNLQREVECRRCHHPKDVYSPATAPEIGCQDCHPEGASLFWCVNFIRNLDPNSNVLDE